MLTSGFIDDGVVDMTGYVCEKRKLNDKDGNFLYKTVAEIDDFWEYLMNNKRSGSLMGCSVAGAGTESHVKIDGEDTGILAGHAYAINDVIELPGKIGKRKIHRLLRVRNPWGKTEWQGKWSD
jgi:hypothetical protein